MEHARVLLIGGAPGVGKTTLGRSLAIRLGITSLTIDDLLTAAKAVTTPGSHPGLHVMQGLNYIEYFTGSSLERLQADATRQHEAAWPAVEKVIRNHASWGSPVVIDGWALDPRRVAQLDLNSVMSFWLVAGPGVLEERERRNIAFTRDSPDPERMLKNFLARSLWYNQLIKEQAGELQLNVLEQNGELSTDELCRMVLEKLDHPAAAR